MMLVSAVVALLLSISGYFLSDVLLSREYLVHDHGIILITGASTGIGSHAAITLAEKGYTVYAGVRKEKDMETIRNMGNKNLFPIQLDVGDHLSCVEAINYITRETERLNIPFVALINNAGISRKLPVEFHDINDAKKVFDTNYFGVLDMVQLTLPLLRKSQGRIIMTSSITGFLARPIDAIYSSSKHALEALSDSLRRELSHFNISVSVIEPAFVKTKIFERSQSAGDDVLLNSREEMMALYGKFYTDKKREAYNRQIEIAPGPSVTSEAILHSITSSKPYTRYPVSSAFGIPASILRWLSKLLPDRLFDLLLEK